MEEKQPGVVEIVGVATDNLIDSGARITRSKRVWQYLPPEDVEVQQLVIMTKNLGAGIPVYTGPVKSERFSNEVLERWNPQVIFMGTFGQLVDAAVYKYPEFGMYNLHPSDLAARKYPGADPFTDMIAEGATTTCVTMHEVDKGIDTGRPIGRSCDIATGYEILSQLPVDRDKVWPHWIAALHSATGFAAAEMAVKAAGIIGAKKRRLVRVDFRDASPSPEWFYTAVVAATFDGLMESGVMTVDQVLKFQAVPQMRAMLLNLGKTGRAL
jgi:hypothetical protein